MTEKDSATPLYVTDAEKWVQETAHGADLCCIVIFRGSWCRYDRHYLQKLGQHHVQTMKSENVKLIAWTSEGREGANKADEEWELTTKYNYDMVIGDETLALAKYLIEDEILPNLTITTPQEMGVVDQITEGTYPNGIVVPGQVWWAHHGLICFEWNAKFDPQQGLVGGPGRPEPNFVWQHVLKRKHALEHGSTVMPLHGEDIKLCSTDLEVSVSSCVIS